MNNEHERSSELLPWYVNATLRGAEAAEVEQHLGACDECRRELSRLRTLTAAGEEDGWTPSPAHFARVMASVDASSQSVWRRLASWVRQTPRPVRFAFALQGAAVLALIAVVALRPPRVYETLSRPPVVSGDRARLHVVFSSDISEGAMRRLLQDAGAVIVGGPSLEGVYTVELSFPVTDKEQARKTADRIAAEPKVRFAAPVAR